LFSIVGGVRAGGGGGGFFFSTAIVESGRQR